ncbi:rubrerythrin [Mobilisporobacter senegalensis]|uniref:Rubrerythrin n=1 Tax=Mobilisporobacter senegalensis TaxID=1329262 RepID=A0A3N1XBJ2_9FIRM|nr:ferritin family protein [Mobilisporobacter senegalensis]ROR23461.1 rubrerythrin [Mobilisporobacter senegalensis]
MEFQKSQTYLNLQVALENELTTSGLYDLYRKRADQEVLLEVRNVFDTFSINAQFIAERLRRILNDGDTSTLQNLIDAANRELYAENNIYREFSRIAVEEGFNDLASLFNGIANIKLNHNITFQTLADDMENNQLFCKERESLWICLGCGNILSGDCAPEICPICEYPQGYYQFYRYL